MVSTIFDNGYIFSWLRQLPGIIVAIGNNKNGNPVEISLFV